MKPYFETKLGKLYCGDCIEVMRSLPENSIDTIITDPPYGIGFMGKKWDNFKPKEIKKSRKLVYKTDFINGKPVKRKKPEWVTRDSGARVSGTYDLSSKGLNGFQKWFMTISEEMLRVTKPGGTLLCFGGTRTYHRLACAVEDAGWILKDCIMWLYGSGFPKATDISKQLDKKAGVEHPKNIPISDNTSMSGANYTRNKMPVKSEQAKLWNGWKSHGLKPAYEPILVAMKPNEGSYAQNALKYGVAGLNIDGGRIGTDEETARKPSKLKKDAISYVRKDEPMFGGQGHTQGRFPANIILDEEAAKMLDGQSGELKSGSMKKSYEYKNNGYSLGKPAGSTKQLHEANQGGASRFFYCAKASKSERNMGCEELPLGKPPASARSKAAEGRQNPLGNPRANHHPTVKPLKLMEYLCRLTKTPTGGVVLDPFMGSGTTGIACVLTGREFIGIEKEKEYIEIAKKRIEAVSKQGRLF